MTVYTRNWLTKVNIYRRKGELYLTRYVIFRCKWFSIYIHQFHVSDYDVPHDHPWWWLALPLRKGYIEHFADGTSKRRYPFIPAIRAPQEFHWVDLIPGTESKVWTFFVTGPVQREWGFLTKEGWVTATNYHEKLGINK